MATNSRAELRIELCEPEGPAGIEEWFSPLSAVDDEEWPDSPSWLLHERTALLDQPGVHSHVLGVARLGGVVAGSSQVRLSLVENLDTVDVEVYVDPAWQRQGVGRALLEAAERVARGHGRTVVTGTTEWRLGSPDQERRVRFARAAGYQPALEEARRELDLPLDPDRLDALERAAQVHAAGYQLITWSGPCPPELEEGRLQVGRAMADRPLGQLDEQPEEWDAERLRLFERMVAAMDRATVAAAAIAPDGSLCGFTEIGIPRSTPAVAYQFDTVVTPPHRGRRLGLLLKVANVRALQEQFPRTRRVVTTNALTNGPMIRVNEQLGFRITGEGIVWQKRLE